jgi:tyrosinase
MLDGMNSVNDPLFWMHHTSMDRLWSLWQEQDLATRLYNPPNITMWMGPMAPNRTVGELYDPLNRNGKGILCYKYEGLQFKYYSS